MQLLPRWLTALIGPELLWLLVYWLVCLLANANHPPQPLFDDLIEGLSVLLPAVTVVLFALWYVPIVEKRWLLWRVWIAGLIGAHFSLETGLSAVSDQGPHVGAAYIAGMVLVSFALVVGSLFVLIRFRFRR
ncbi:hypothetical protein [Fibrivirga algicola]|uniref:DUF2569 family protein n=1 Tax=Fibrivirga algicola TaxID=2950420 RepID=A0ABX0QIY5_9BACT|nr:hypothetical protein [Fibrivirga algicola]ARK12477.1 hypothetical protein A6C57_20245 [Fibrella sp. ES10-3-2-2]NID12380.1 hypothetical protein [Fibrivirga algicola]